MVKVRARAPPAQLLRSCASPSLREGDGILFEPPLSFGHFPRERGQPVLAPPAQLLRFCASASLREGDGIWAEVIRGLCR